MQNKISKNKKLITFLAVGLLISVVLFFPGSKAVMAANDSTIEGNLPNTFGNGVNVYVYNAAQDDPCDGLPDGGEVSYGNALWGTISGNLDTTYINTDTDYSITVDGGTISGVNLYVYFCDNSNNIIDTYNVGDFATNQTRNISLGKISNGASSAHNDLDNYRVVICAAVGGSKYNDVTKQVDASTNQYVQYYAFQQAADDGGGSPPSAITTLFDSDSDDCTNDTTKRTGYVIDVATSSDNYGIVIAYNPDTKVTGDMIGAADLNTAVFTIYDDAGTAETLTDDTSAGMGFEINAGNPNGDGANDDFIIYYDATKVTNDIHVQIVTASNGTTHWLSIDEADFNDLAGGGAGDYDILVDLNDAGGGVPSDIDDIQVTCNVNNGVAPDDDAIFKTVALHDTYLYDIYMPDCSNSEIVIFKKSGNEVYRETGVDLTASATIDVGKVAGTAHSDLRNETTDAVEVYSNTTCTSKESSATVRPDAADGSYEIYFEEVGANYYLKLIDDNTYNTCGNHFTLTNQAKANHDPATKVSGKRVTGVAAVVIDPDEGFDYDPVNDAGDAYTTDFSSDNYVAYTVSTDTSDYVFFDGTDQTGGNILLTVTKDLNTSQIVNVAKVTGNEDNIHSDLNGNSWDIRVSDAAADNGGALVSTVWPNIDASNDGDTSETYTTYFEVPAADGLVNFGFFNSGTLSSFLYNATSEAAVIYTFEPDAKLVVTVPGSGDNVEAVSDVTGDIYNKYRDNDNETTKTIYIDKNAGDRDGSGSGTSGTTDTTGTYNLYTDDTFATLVLTRGTKDLTAAAQTWGVAKIIGDVHTNLDEGTDYVEICSNITCATKYSSETVNPVTGTNNDDSFAQYYEVASGGSTDIFIHIRDADTPNYDAYVDLDVINGGAISPGDTDTQDLTEILSGTTTAALDWVWVDDSTGNDDGTWEFAGDIEAAGYTYRLYHGFTSAHSRKIKFDEDNDESNEANLVITKDIDAVATFHVDRVQGDVPTDFEGDTFEIESSASQACGGGNYGSSTDTVAADVTGQTPDYRMYYESTGSTTYYVLFCDGATKELERSSTSGTTGGGTDTIDVAKVSGDTHADLNAGGTDFMAIYSDTACTATLISSETETPLSVSSPDYTQYYEPTNGTTTYYMKATMDDTSNTFDTCVKFSGSGAQAADTVTLTIKMSGTVHSDVLTVAVDIDATPDGAWDSFTDTFVADAYNLYTVTGDNSDKAYFYDAADAGGNLLLSRDAVLDADETMDVNRLTGSLHADLQNTSTSDDVQVYSGTNCVTTLLSSEDAITAAGASYNQYYERDGGNNIMIKITDNDDSNDHITCYDFETSEPAAGGSSTADLTVKVSGNVGSGIITAYFDNDGTSGDWEGTQTIVTATDPDSYKVYLPAGKGTDWDVKFNSGGTELIRTAKDYDVAGSYTLNVGKVSGTSKSALTALRVYTNADCTTGQVSSEGENPDATYTQYFEGTDSTTFYIATEDGTHTPCLNSGFGITNQEGTANFNNKLSGSVPDVSSTTIDVLSVTADSGDDTYWVNTVDPGAAVNTYAIYLDSADSLITSTAVVFKDAATGTGNTLLTVTKDLSSDGMVDVSVAYGNVHGDIDDTLGEINTVCYSTLPTSNADCATKAATVSPAAAATYEIFFEQVSAVTTYYLQIADSDTQTYYSWNIFTSASAGDYIGVEVDGKLDGYVAEEWDSPTTRVPDVTIKMYTDGGDPDTNQVSLTYSYTGTTTPGGNYRMYGNSGTQYDGQYAKAGYITQSGVDTGSLSGTVNVDLLSGIKVTVSHAGGQTVDDATVALYVCSGTANSTCGITLDTCINPSGNCTITGDGTAGTGEDGKYYFAGMTNGTYVQVKVTRTSFDTMYDPDKSGGALAYTVSSTAQILPTFTVINPVPGVPNLRTPANGFATVDDTPTLTWYDLLGDENYYQIQVDDDVDFVSVVSGTTTGAVNTWDVSSTLDNNTKYYWRVRASDDGGVSRLGDWSEVGYFYVNTGWDSIGAPTIVTSGSQVTISWSAVTGAVNYQVYRDSDSTVTISDTPVDGTPGTGLVDYPGTGNWWYAIVAVDEANNISTISTVSATATIDVTAPTNLVISINGGVEYTTTATATLTLFASGATQMQFTCDASTTWSSAVSYATTATFNMNTGAGCTASDGSKQVTVRMLDAAGNSATAFDVIILDSTAPDVSGVTAAVTTTTDNGKIIISWTAATDTGGSGVANYTIYRSTSTPVASTDTEILSLPGRSFLDSFNSDGTYYYAITATDEAGNTSGISSSTAGANIDVTGPEPVSILINPGNSFATSTTLALTLFAGGAANMQFSCDGGTSGWTTLEDYSTTKNLDLATAGAGCTTTDGTKIVYVKMLDTLGNYTYEENTITLDTTIDTNLSSLLPTTTVTQSDTSYTWSWTSATDNGSGIYYYYVEVSDDNGATWIYEDDEVFGNTFTLTGLAINSTGYVIRVTAYDEAGNSSTTVTSAGKLIIGQVPTISSVVAGTIGTTTATITWSSTVTSTDNKVEYGTTSALGSTATTTTGISHSVGLTGLSANTLYYYKVWSTSAGQAKYSSILTFTTGPGVVTITNIGALDTIATAGGGYAAGWSWRFEVTVPTAETSLQMRFANWTGTGGTIAVANNIRFYSSESSDASTTASAITITVADTYSVGTMTLTGDRVSSKGGRQIWITMEAKIPLGTSGGSYSSSYGILAQ